MQHSADSSEPEPDFIKWLRENCVPIAGTVFGALVLCLVVHYSSTTVDWTRTKDFADAFANLTQSLALLAGGVWAYFEPNEIVERQTLIALPRLSSVGYQLEFEVFSNSGYIWRATAIVDKSAFAHNEVG